MKLALFRIFYLWNAFIMKGYSPIADWFIKRQADKVKRLTAFQKRRKHMI
jgi:hypothetical protein